MNKAVTMLKLPDVCSWAMNHYVSLSLTNRKSSVHLRALNSPRTAISMLTARRDQIVICGQYRGLGETFVRLSPTKRRGLRI
jgi:hypothetical protein